MAYRSLYHVEGKRSGADREDYIFAGSMQDVVNNYKHVIKSVEEVRTVEVY